MQKTKKIDRMENLLKKQGFRLTQPRRVILDLLSKTQSHLPAKDIYMKIRRNHPHVGLTTVYRTLDLMVRIGVIKKFEFGEGQSRYELTWEFKEHHHHLVCLACGKIIDYNDFIQEEVKFFDKIQRNLSKKYRFNIKHHEVYFYGHCREC